MAHTTPLKLDRTLQTLALFGLVVFGFGLAQFAYAGTFSRYWADDYCYSATVRQLGVIRGVVDWYNTSGNRVSTLFPVALSELFGPQAIQWIPLTVLALWVGAWVYFLLQVRRLFGWRHIPVLWVLFLAAVQVYFAVLLAPDRLQTVYWRMGTLHYTLPLPLLLLNLGLLTGRWHKPAAGPWVEIVCGLLAFFAAGLSETFAALQTGLLIAGIAGIWAVRRLSRQVIPIRPLVLPLVGSLLMMLVMTQAPANAWRQAVMPPPENLLDILPVTLRHAADFFFYSVRGKPVPFLVYALVLLGISLLSFDPAQQRFSLRGSMIGLLVSLLATYALIVCSFAPSSFAGMLYPAGRAQMPAHFALLAGLGCAVFFAAAAVRLMIWQKLPWFQWAVVILLLAASLYPFRADSIFEQDLDQLTDRAARWDTRSEEIWRAVAAGETDLQVREVDVVEGLEDIGPNPDFWINRCASVFFGANTITARP